MNITATAFPGLCIIQPTVLTDARGYFFESYQETRYTQHGLPHFVQVNVSRSTRGVLRGMHYQKPHAQGKLVSVIHGIAWDVVIDLRQSSPMFRQWFNITLSSDNHTQLYIPPGFAHGFCALSDTVDFCYQCSDYYSPESERGIAWNDASLNIPWPVSDPIVSVKDTHYPLLSDLSDDALFA